MSAAEKNAEAIAGIQKHTKSREELEREIREFLHEASSKPGTSTKPGCPLNHGLACVLATVHENMPRATPVDFFCDGLTIWIAGEPGLKIRNIRSNPGVAVGIYHPMDHSRLNRSLQIQGTAALFNVTANREEVVARAKQFGIFQAIEKMMQERPREINVSPGQLEEEVMEIIRRFNFIRIEPDEIIFLNIHPTQGTTKDVWKKAP
jgi:nitroimidazol reductase NimA-like FMN-containing flavoprotein (pyridoxamine 5'-phosphate oxidase superfamily)